MPVPPARAGQIAARRWRSRPDADQRPVAAATGPLWPLPALVPLPELAHPGGGWLLDVRCADIDGFVTLVDASANWGWGPATPLACDPANAVLAVRYDPAGGHRLQSRHRLRLPLAWRRSQNAGAGRRLAVLTGPPEGPQVVLVELADRLTRRAGPSHPASAVHALASIPSVS